MVHAKFVLSAASAADFPTTGLPEVAMVGRSNVGKSSLINALAKQKVARTSAAPGKTRLANFYLIHAQSPKPNARGPAFYLVDLPGYGYARGGRDSVEAFETLTKQYFEPAPGSGRAIAGVLHLVDSRHPDLPQDAAAFEWLMRAGLDITIVATKMDKLRRADQQKTLAALTRHYGVQVLPVSVTDNAGLDDIRKHLRVLTNP